MDYACRLEPVGSGKDDGGRCIENTIGDADWEKGETEGVKVGP